jgi:integrase/recombinase XerD
MSLSLLPAFKQYLRNRCIPETKIHIKLSTQENHYNGVKRILRNCQPLTEETFTEYINQRSTISKNEKSVNQIILTGRVYYQFLESRKKHIGFEWLRDYPLLIEIYKPEKETMSDQEIEAFLALPPSRPQTNVLRYRKWTMFFKILAFSGMRPCEVASMTVDRVDFGRELFILPQEMTKTHKTRYVPIAPNISKELQDYVKNLNSDYLFPGESKGDRKIVNDVNWSYNFRHRIKRLGIKRKRLTCYSLRHSMGTRLTEEDVAISKIMKLLGHTNINTTLIYTHLTQKDIKEAIRKHPLIKRYSNPEYVLQSMSESFRSFHIENDTRFDFRLNMTQDCLDLKVKIIH